MTIAPAAPSDATVTDPRIESRLSDPQVVESLLTLLDHADLLAVLLSGLDGLLARNEVIGENLAGAVGDLKGLVSGATTDTDIASMASAGVSLLGILPKAAPHLVSAVESGALDKLLATAEVSAGALDQVEVLARALVAGTANHQSNPVEVSGPLSLLKLLKDPDINRAIGYFATIAQAVGRELAATPRTSTPSAN